MNGYQEYECPKGHRWSINTSAGCPVCNPPPPAAGGPAFPCGPAGDSRTYEDGTTSWQFPPTTGMSLRAWLAGQALAGLMVNVIEKPKDAAALCVNYADAVLAELNKDHNEKH